MNTKSKLLVFQIRYIFKSFNNTQMHSISRVQIVELFDWQSTEKYSGNGHSDENIDSVNAIFVEYLKIHISLLLHVGISDKLGCKTYFN